MVEAERKPSPWWYRQRGSVFGVIYGLGFFLGYLSFGGSDPQPAFVAWGERLGGGHGASILMWIGVASAFFAWFWRASGTAFLSPRVVFAADVQPDRLIVAGPFRYVRNPLYVGNIFLALSIALLASPLGFVIILIGNAAFVVPLAAEESRGMALRYGAVYEAFRKAVPAFVPRLRPANVPGSVSVAPSWRAALLAESYCLGVACALIPIALFGAAGVPAFWAIFAPVVLIFIAFGWWVGRSSAAAR